MISIIITAKNEAKTIKRAVLAFVGEKLESSEIIVVAPDQETLESAKDVGEPVIAIRDLGHGKSAALNLAIRQARGEKVIFSDGDVEIKPGAARYLAESDGDLVSGQPVAQKNQIGIFGFWQNVLFDTAHRIRVEKSSRGAYFPVSGYLFLARRETLADFVWPEESLAEDDFFSHYAWHKGFKIKYEERAEVNVLAPKNFSDWLKQKVRTLAASYQIPKEWQVKEEPRSFWGETSGGGQMWKKYALGPKEKVWLLALFGARLLAWLIAFWRVKILGQKREKIWQRVESTK
ncbi:glycosyltransferase family 2 protein [Candidatus Kuenenbacteria bacterium]|nr:glycosyltransferase family 2 protein [Candidatus Kuenenbacteria bacterium]